MPFAVFTSDPPENVFAGEETSCLMDVYETSPPLLLVPIVPGTKGTEAGFKVDLISLLLVLPNELVSTLPMIGFVSSYFSLYKKFDFELISLSAILNCILN